MRAGDLPSNHRQTCISPAAVGGAAFARCQDLVGFAVPLAYETSSRLDDWPARGGLVSRLARIGHSGF